MDTKTKYWRVESESKPEIGISKTESPRDQRDENCHGLNDKFQGAYKAYGGSLDDISLILFC
jgi:hypothetical protein